MRALRDDGPTVTSSVLGSKPYRRWFGMRMLLALLAVMLAIPPLLVAAIATGPILLLVLWAILVVAPFLLLGWAIVSIGEARLRHKGG
jgi:hypothetical protein